jgi:hypothetical protein
MKTKIVVLVCTLMCFSVQSQTNPVVENYPLKAMDLVVIPFGSEYPVNIGTISDSGELNFKFPTDLPAMPQETKDNFSSSIVSALFSKCDNNDDFYSEHENIKSADVRFITLSSKENPYQGLFFIVSDEKLVPWLEDSYANSPVAGSYFGLIYMFSDFNYQGTCTATDTYSDDTIIETIYDYDLQLKKGFNFIEYKIDSVKEYSVPSMDDENVMDKIVQPTKITITSSQTTVPNAKWIGKYF